MRAIDPELRDRIRPELRLEEKLLWVGKPVRFPLSFVSGFNLFIILFWLPLIAFVIYNNGGVQDVIDAGIPPWLLGVALLIFGFFLARQSIMEVIGPSKEVYAITSDRGIILRDFIRRRVTSRSPDVLKNAHRKGNLSIGTLDFYPSRAISSIMVAEHNLTAFRNISEPKSVEDLIYRTFARASGA